MASSVNDQCDVSYSDAYVDSNPTFTDPDEQLPHSASTLSNMQKTIQDELLRERIRQNLLDRNEKAADKALNDYTKGIFKR